MYTILYRRTNYVVRPSSDEDKDIFREQVTTVEILIKILVEFQLLITDFRKLF